MLSFTQNSQFNRTSNNQLDFQPLVISNKSPQQIPLTLNPQKKITKAHSNSRSQSKQGTKQASFRQRNARQIQIQRDNWADGGKIEVFDKQLRKNQLAAEQRRIKAQLKKEKLNTVTNFTHKQKDIRAKTLQLEKEQQTQIEKLKALINKQRQQKEKNDRIYQQKFQQIERQRNQLIHLQRKIQQKGVRNQREFKKQLKVLQKEQYPTNDRAKCHQDIRTNEQHGRQFQVSESQANHQRQALRQKQLQLLTQQRERNLQNKPTLGYNPTIIPLLSRASYKIISTHISTLVQLFVDDLLQQQVFLLEKIELEQQMEKQKQKEKEIINDYYQKLAQFADQVQRIEDNVGRYQTMKFQDIYIPKKYDNQYKGSKPSKSQQILSVYTLKGLESDVLQEIESRRERFVRFVGNFDQYKKSNINMFQDVTQELINEAIQKLVQELDRGSNDFVQLIFRKQFQ